MPGAERRRKERDGAPAQGDAASGQGESPRTSIPDPAADTQVLQLVVLAQFFLPVALVAAAVALAGTVPPLHIAAGFGALVGITYLCVRLGLPLELFLPVE